MKRIMSVFAALLLVLAVIAPAFAAGDPPKIPPKGTEGPDIRQKPKQEIKGTEGPDIRKQEPKGTEGPDVRKKSQ